MNIMINFNRTNRFGFIDVYSNGLRNETYVVKKGDTLSSIAQKYKVSVESIMEENNLSNTTIYPKQVIVIPMKINNGGMYFEEYVILPNDTLEIIASKLGITPDLITRYNDITRLILAENQTLKIPKVLNTYTITEDDTLASILSKNNMTLEELVEYNKDNWLKPTTEIYVK